MLGLWYPDQAEMRVVASNPVCPYSRKSGNTGPADEEYVRVAPVNLHYIVQQQVNVLEHRSCLLAMEGQRSK